MKKNDSMGNRSHKDQCGLIDIQTEMIAFYFNCKNCISEAFSLKSFEGMQICLYRDLC